MRQPRVKNLQFKEPRNLPKEMLDMDSLVRDFRKTSGLDNAGEAIMEMIYDDDDDDLEWCRASRTRY
ncbi:hypothetical protein SLEP1_g7613 [Rubroshorea leprosula]|uniref:Uncharacterized protein n=1 Tax=Rubroshorea leprosula TaxID=152421 RepID=A0AAV5I3I7_9ROSI|nr:hypothetical protein SLEP1_g7613 [Rubroshorea leprosula]